MNPDAAEKEAGGVGPEMEPAGVVEELVDSSSALQDAEPLRSAVGLGLVMPSPGHSVAAALEG